MDCNPDIPPIPSKGKLSTRAFMESCGRTCVNYPSVVLSLGLFFLWSVFESVSPSDMMAEQRSSLEPGIWWYVTLMVTTTLGISIWCDRFRRDARMIAIFVAVVLLTLELMLAPDYHEYSYVSGEMSPGWWRKVSLLFGSIISVLFLPAIRRESLDSAWAFSYRQVSSLGLAGLVSIIFIVSSGIILGTISLFFGANITELLFICFSLGGVVIPALVFVSRIRMPGSNPFMPRLTGVYLGIVNYVILPLIFIYAAVIYVYGVKILLTLSLPKDSVAWPVSVFVAGVMVAQWLIYPMRTNARRSISVILASLMIPALVMMTVALCYRIHQYGFTAPRLYMLTFNVWSYAVAGCLIASRGRQVCNLLIATAAIFLLTSVMSYANYASLCHGSIKIDESGMHADESVIEEVPTDTIEDVWVPPMIKVQCRNLSTPVNIPYGYRQMRPVDIGIYDLPVVDGSVSFDVKGEQLSFDLDSLSAVSKLSMLKPQCFSSESGAMLMTTNIVVSFKNETMVERLQINGYMFFKEPYRYTKKVNRQNKK